MKNNLKSIIEYIFDNHNSEKEFLGEGFLSSVEVKMCLTLKNLHYSKWDSATKCKAYRIIEEHKEKIIDFIDCFDNIEKPNFSEYELAKSSDLIKVGFDNTLIISKKTGISFEEIKEETSDYIYINLNIKNIFNLINRIKEINIQIPKKVIQYINLYLNNINHETEENLIYFNNYNRIPKAFQSTGILFGLLNKNIMIADEMGLGKTIQGLGIISYADAFPLIIVCPNSLKYKWLNECQLIKDKKISIIDSSTKNFDDLSDIYIMGYESVKKHIEKIELNNNIKSVIFDECHYLKNPKTKRAKSCKRLTNKKEYIIELSGSPLLNRTNDLINQIDILNRLEDIGGYQYYIDNYCINEKEERLKKYKEKKDIECGNIREYCLNDNNCKHLNYKELSEKLKMNFYIRREKKDILKDLPPKTRTILPVEINNKSEYQKILKEYKIEKDLKKKKNILEQLKEKACQGKMDAIIERIESHIENKEKVVVFAYHKKMQEDLINIFPDALKITASQNDFERNKNAIEFQENEDKLIIICSISIANCGFDLFSASQVLFTEMDWVPLINIQCEDRTHRIGQKDCVNVWYLIAKDTIEEQIVKINKEKMEIIDQVNGCQIPSFNMNIRDLVMELLEKK